MTGKGHCQSKGVDKLTIEDRPWWLFLLEKGAQIIAVKRMTGTNALNTAPTMVASDFNLSTPSKHHRVGGGAIVLAYLEALSGKWPWQPLRMPNDGIKAPVV
jgi:hypothetical protein